MQYKLRIIKHARTIKVCTNTPCDHLLLVASVASMQVYSLSNRQCHCRFSLSRKESSHESEQLLPHMANYMKYSKNNQLQPDAP